MDSLTVSIIVPNFNHEQFLQRRLDSIFSQSYDHFEVILLDDASTDGSPELLQKYKEYPKVTHLVINEVNSGSPFAQWKKGMELAKGDFIWMAESDDYCEPEFLEELLLLNSENNNTLDIIYSQSVDVDAQGNEVSNRIEYTANYQPNIWTDNFTMDGKSFIGDYLKEKCVIPNASAVIFRRSLLESQPLSKDHLKMKICGDWYFWLKLAKKGKIGFVAKSLNYFRFHPNVSRIQTSYHRVYLRCSEEKKIREYLKSEYSFDQEEELETLYKKWFRVNKFAKLFSKQFYDVRMSDTTILKYIRLFLRSHQTGKKLVKKLKV